MQNRSTIAILILLIVFAILSVFNTCFADAHRILLEGQFDDWDAIEPLYDDPIGDQVTGDLDLGRFWVANDEEYVFFCFEIGVEIILQEGNDVTLYLDTDNDSETGDAINTIGADTYWTFGDRAGRFYSGISSYSIAQYKLGLLAAPTVTSARFEIAMRRDAMPIGQELLFPGDTVAVVIKDQGDGQDQLPAPGETIYFVIDDTPLPPLEPLTLDREDPTHLRVMTYNVHLDDFFQSWATDAYTRILNAIDPDVIAFQEIYDHNVFETLDRVEAMLPGTWYGVKLPPDLVVCSRYPFADTESIEGDNGAYLINLEADYDCEFLLIDCHLPAFQNNFDRQLEVDAVMAFIRDAKAGTGPMTLDDNTPILITGDMNLIGYSTQLNTLITGNIVYQGTHGAPFDPDWDDSDLFDLTPRHVVGPVYHTWIGSPTSGSYCPGRLDFMVYTDYVMTAGTNFVLYTPGMTTDLLTTYGLSATDTDIASDHLPVVCDFWLHLGTPVEPEDRASLPTEFAVRHCYPNPFNAETVIPMELPQRSKVQMELFNVQGRNLGRVF
ncbi:MAG: endonuclease/exonuclease/phosphatase family protein, partial [bacterium]